MNASTARIVAICGPGRHGGERAEIRWEQRWRTSKRVCVLSLRSSSRRAARPIKAVRYIKHFAPGYLYMPLDQARWPSGSSPSSPGRAIIERHSRAQSLDPFLIAALIRQNREFNVKVVSYANAYGLDAACAGHWPRAGAPLRYREIKHRAIAHRGSQVQLEHTIFGSF